MKGYLFFNYDISIDFLFIHTHVQYFKRISSYLVRFYNNITTVIVVSMRKKKVYMHINIMAINLS